MFNLSGRVALITGGAGGLGKQFARAILERGGRVCSADLNSEDGLRMEAEFCKEFGSDRSLFVRTDVTNRADLERVFDETKRTFGRLDIIVNNAGIGNEDDWERTIDINLKAVIRGSYLAVEHISRLKGGAGGVLVNVASTAGLTPVPYMSAYSASKHGVVGFTRSLAMSLGPLQSHGIRVVTICPSFTETKILEAVRASESTRHFLDLVGVMDVSEVVKAFVKVVVEEEDNHGSVLMVTPRGIKYKFHGHVNNKL